MTFAAQGKNSKAWWLKGVKDYPTKVTLAHALEISLNDTKEALDSLTYSGLISLAGSKNVLTSIGYRYLNEHQDELKERRFEVFDPNETKSESKLESKMPARHSITPAPVFAGPPELRRQASRERPIDSGEPLSAIPTDPTLPTAAELSEGIDTLKAESEKTMPDVETMSSKNRRAYLDEVQALREKYGITDTAEAPVIKSAIERATFDILFERYGDQITIKDILERL